MLLFCNSHFVMSNACEISLFFTIFEIPHTWFGMTQHYVSTAVYSPFRFDNAALPHPAGRDYSTLPATNCSQRCRNFASCSLFTF